MFKLSAILLVVVLFSIGFIHAAYAANTELYTIGNVLAAGNYNNSATSSDLTLIIKMSAGDTVFVDEGSEVLYTVPTANIDGWTERNFNDSGWTKGISGVGYADNDDNTVITGPVPSIYTRYHFDAPNASSVKEVTFLMDYDDLYILWLNGVEVYRAPIIRNIAAGKVPGFDELTKAGITDHESTHTDAGKPNATRWTIPAGTASGLNIGRCDVNVDFGDVASAVSLMTKLSLSWGEIKSGKAF